MEAAVAVLVAPLALVEALIPAAGWSGGLSLPSLLILGGCWQLLNAGCRWLLSHWYTQLYWGPHLIGSGPVGGFDEDALRKELKGLNL